MTDAYVGEIRLWPGMRCPTDWLFCNGATLPISTYQVLFAVIGTTYGGDGQTNFKIPDLRNAVPIHQGQGTGLTLRPIGSTGGTATVTLTEAQLPNHTHTMAVSSVSADTVSTPVAGGAFASASAASGMAFYGTVGHTGTINDMGPSTILPNSSSNSPHQNLMPSQTLNFIICTQGIFPSQN